MLQRNPGAYPLVFPTLDPPVTVPAGAEIDHPVLLAGFEPVEDDTPAKPKPAPARAATEKPAPAAPPAAPAEEA